MNNLESRVETFRSVEDKLSKIVSEGIASEAVNNPYGSTGINAYRLDRIVESYSRTDRYFLEDRLEGVLQTIESMPLNREDARIAKEVNDKMFKDYLKRVCGLSSLEFEKLKESPKEFYSLIQESINSPKKSSDRDRRRETFKKFLRIDHHLQAEIKKPKSYNTQSFELLMPPPSIERKSYNPIKIASRIAKAAVIAGTLMFGSYAIQHFHLNPDVSKTTVIAQEVPYQTPVDMVFDQE